VGEFLRPGHLDDALAALAGRGFDGPPWVIVAGATDHYPARVGRQPDEDVLDITAIAALRGVAEVDGGWRIGALTTWADLAETDLPPLFDGLRAAGLAVGGRQIQARATVVGNVCNASPAADGIPNLLALDTAVELASGTGTRRLPIGEFVTGNRRTAREPHELVTGLFVSAPAAPGRARSAFEKLGSRAYLVISIVMVAAVIEIDERGRLSAARIAVGACSEVAQRLPLLEADLRGRQIEGLGDELDALVRPEHLASLSPIDDVRGSPEYRREAALVLVRRALRRLL
jgi:CO/xanthine dehydrogenase FAD-binding subunit